MSIAGTRRSWVHRKTSPADTRYIPMRHSCLQSALRSTEAQRRRRKTGLARTAPARRTRRRRKHRRRQSRQPQAHSSPLGNTGSTPSTERGRPGGSAAGNKNRSDSGHRQEMRTHSKMPSRPGTTDSPSRRDPATARTAPAGTGGMTNCLRRRCTGPPSSFHSLTDRGPRLFQLDNRNRMNVPSRSRTDLQRTEWGRRSGSKSQQRKWNSSGNQ